MYSPVGSVRITSSYLGGFRSTGGHSGIDFGARTGTPIRAAVPGVVVGAGWSGGYGNLVRVRHVDGTMGYYAHMSRIGVRVGSRVNRGSVLGAVGSTGNSTGPHLHFEVRRNGRPVNPRPWLIADHREIRGNPRAMTATAVPRRNLGKYKLTSEQLRNASRIVAVGRSMGATQRDLVIALMTAYQESNLRNLNYGDRDSLGLFQQRPSAGWGSPSQVRNPEYAARKFFSTLFKVRNRTGLPLTAAAQAVQRSAFPNAYAKWEGLARAILGGGQEFEFEEELPLEEELPPEEPLDGMIPQTVAGGFVSNILDIPGTEKREQGSFVNPLEDLSRAVTR